MKMIPFFVSQGKNEEKSLQLPMIFFGVVVVGGGVVLLLPACFTAHIGKESRQAGNPGFIEKE